MITKNTISKVQIVGLLLTLFFNVAHIICVYGIDPVVFVEQLRCITETGNNELIRSHIMQRHLGNRTILQQNPISPWTAEQFDEVCDTFETADGDLWAFLTAADNYGFSVLMLRDSNEDIPLVRALLARVKHHEPRRDAVRFLLLQDRCDRRRTALFTGNPGIVKLLIAAVLEVGGADAVCAFIEITDSRNSTALHYMCLFEGLSLVNMLLTAYERHGGNVMNLLLKKDCFGTPLANACHNFDGIQAFKIAQKLIAVAHHAGGLTGVKQMLAASEPTLSLFLREYEQYDDYYTQKLCRLLSDWKDAPRYNLRSLRA